MAEDMKGCAVSAVAIWILLLFIAIKACVLQWLLGLFGWDFGFWEVVGIMIALDFLIGCYTSHRK